MNIIGRKAFNRHSNLFYDFDERLIYISGCNLVLHYIRDDDEEDEDEDDNNNSDDNDFKNDSKNMKKRG